MENGPGQAVATDRGLWDRLRSADEHAFAELFHRHCDAVHNFAFRRTSSWSAAEDVVQATFATLWRRARTGRVDPLDLDSARPLLLVMAGHECGNVLRSSRRQAALRDRIQLIDSAGTAEPDHSSVAAAKVDDERAMSDIRRILDKLPAKQREVVELVVWSECSMAEAAPPRRSRTWLIPVGAAASITLIATGALIASGQHADTTPAPPAADPTPTRTNNAGPADVHIDAGPVTGAEKNAAVQACLVTVGQGSATPAVVGHAVKVRSWVEGKVDTTIAVIGYACVGRGGPWDATAVAVGRNGKVVGNPPDATHPAAPTDGTGARLLFVDFDRKPDLLVQEGWYNVDDRVATMRQRWIVRGKPGPWYVAQAADGLVYLRSWNESAALKVGEQVRVETQVLDRDGRLLDAPADQKGGGGLTPSPGTTRVDVGTVVRLPGQQLGDIRFTK